MGEHNDKEHYVAWLDLLGFSDMIERDPTSKVAKLLEKDIPAALNLVVPKAVLNDGAIVLGEHRCEIEQFQDTLVLWTRETRVEDLEALLDVTAGMMLVFHRNGLPCRGGVSKGTLYTSRLNENADQNIRVVIGRGVKRAHDQEKDRAWAGVTIDPKLAQDEDVRIDVLEARKPSGRIAKYGKHTKDGTQDWCIGWPSLLQLQTADEIIGKMWPTEPPAGKPRLIRDNTRDFVAWWKTTFGIDGDRIERASRGLAESLK